MGATLDQGRRLWLRLDGRRHSIRLGRMRKRDAEQLRERIDSVLAARESGLALDGDARRWLARLSDGMYAKLVAIGLLEARQSAQLGTYLENYIASRLPDTKESTRLVYGHTRRCLVEFFGESKAIASVTRGDAERWRRWLASEPSQRLAENTCRRRVGIARQFFNQAIKDGLLDAGANPFAGLKVSLKRVDDRFFYVTDAIARKVLDACSDAEWRAMFALARWGGLRVPSEVLELRLSDVNWAENRITVRSPKTAHHDNHGTRVIPLFAELRSPLLECDNNAQPGDVYVIRRYRDATQNLRTQLTRIIESAGLEAWPKLWQNLRATRATELSQSHPGHVVAAWMGHSEAICQKHYLTVTDADFTKALGGGAKVVQQGPELTNNDRQGQNAADRESPFADDNRPLPVSADSSNKGGWALKDSNSVFWCHQESP